jgi:hypothetical protein
MALTVDGSVNTLIGKLVRDSDSAAGAPSATGVSVLFKGLLPTMCHKVRVNWNALTAAAATQSIVRLTLPAGFVLQRVIAEVVTAFAGTSVTDVDCEVGILGGDTDAFMKTVDIDTAALIKGQVIADFGVNLVDATRADVTVTANEFAAQPVDALFTAAGANVSAMTSGTIDFYLIGHQLPLS